MQPIRDHLQGGFEKLLDAPLAEGEAGLAALGADALDAFERISVLCDRAGLEPHALPDPARRAYAWFGALSDPAERRSHLAALRVANGVDRRVRVRFYNTASLYRFVPVDDGLQLTAQQAFVWAPRDVLTALVRLGVPYTRRRKLRAVVAAHVETLEFKERIVELERYRRPAEGSGRGRHVDLVEAFRRVNRAYFQGSLPQPLLAWSHRVRRQEYGRYDPVGDTVWLNPILDDPQIPGLVLDFVVYHELLHKALGIHFHAGRRRAHTPAFREAEGRYAHHAQAEAYLKELGEQLRRR